MKSLRLAACLLLGLLAGCHASPEGTAPMAAATSRAVPQVARMPSKLDRLFVPDAINGKLAWFESIAGPAIQVLDKGDGSQTRLYRVDGCHVETTTTRASIDTLTLQLGPHCSVSLQAMLPSATALDLTTLHFAELFKAGAGDIALTCAGFAECGTSTDPSLQASLGGSHADGFLSVEFSGSLTTDADVGALQQVMETEAKRLGRSGPDLTADVYGRDPQLPALIRARLGGVKVDHITLHASP